MQSSVVFPWFQFVGSTEVEACVPQDERNYISPSVVYAGFKHRLQSQKEINFKIYTKQAKIQSKPNRIQLSHNDVAQ